ncbi:hypothetical protein C8J57DRAFT_1316152 [Mycena rebaudengoi]|nr:hypothetical protein C8J57DRAFT_1316152 [Mycena rebaudengoi]
MSQVRTPSFVAAQGNGSSTRADIPMSVPTVEPLPFIVDRFWKRVAELTTRYHDHENKWIGGEEIRQWNQANRQACGKCLNSKTKRVCIIDEDHPSCRACRHVKIGCDRKTQFVFDLTREEFFPSFTQFLSIFRHPGPGRMRRDKKLENRIRSKARKRPYPAPTSDTSEQTDYRSPSSAPDVQDGNDAHGPRSAQWQDEVGFLRQCLDARTQELRDVQYALQLSKERETHLENQLAMIRRKHSHA